MLDTLHKGLLCVKVSKMGFLGFLFLRTSKRRHFAGFLQNLILWFQGKEEDYMCPTHGHPSQAAFNSSRNWRCFEIASEECRRGTEDALRLYMGIVRVKQRSHSWVGEGIITSLLSNGADSYLHFNLFPVKDKMHSCRRPDYPYIYCFKSKEEERNL